MSIKPLTQTGDTIVEVMICLSILGAAMAASYGIASRSLAQMQAAQERTEALNIAQEQIERLKQVLVTNPGAIYPIGSPPAFCINKSLGVTKNLSNATSCVSDTNPNYYMGIIYLDQDPGPGVDNEFIAIAGRAAIGSSAGGSPSQIATVNYKVY